MDFIRHEKILIRGVVQGVGFRPFILRTALAMGIEGEALNEGAGVVIWARAGSAALDCFAAALARPTMPGARVDELTRTPVPAFGADGFVIAKSVGGSLADVSLTPDLPICADCAAELLNPSSRRFRHAMISCASCGPRFSILENMPYDRPNTSMRAFGLCAACQREYNSPADRRCHAQTVSCRDCGPQAVYRRGPETFEGDGAISQAAQDILAGRLVACKGIGGYHIACLPSSEAAVAALRLLKGREKKPFAVMFPDILSAEESCAIRPEERELLLSDARPIVLLEGECCLAVAGVAAGSLQTGCFLAYTPLQLLLLEQTGPLVMTSLNRSDSPIIADDGDALSFGGLAGVLTHPRAIRHPLDDSVAQIVRGGCRVIRRARGLVPGFVRFSAPKNVLALGGDLKAAFCVADGGKAVLSAPFGDLDDARSRAVFCGQMEDFLALTGAKPEIVVCDTHPGYFGTAYAPDFQKPVLAVQHHHAHIAAVMAEHALRGELIGVAMDGTGYGPDRSVWGGEALICDERRFERFVHLPAVAMAGGDRAAKDARLALDCHLHAAGLSQLTTSGQVIQKALETGIGTIATTSAGRLFDAVSCFLGICSFNSYEGQCAVELERAAARALHRGAEAPRLTICGLWEQLAAMRGYSAEAAALGFHRALADWIIQTCAEARRETGLNRVVLSGGVFFNSLLLEMAVEGLSTAGFSVFFGRNFPPGDASLALGQAYIGSFYS